MEGRDIQVHVSLEFLDDPPQKKNEKEKSGRRGRRKNWDPYLPCTCTCLNIIHVDMKKILVVLRIIEFSWLPSDFTLVVCMEWKNRINILIMIILSKVYFK